MTGGEQPSDAAVPHLLRPMEPGDIPAIAAIEREAFPTTWPPTPFRKELSNRLARYLVASRWAGAPPPEVPPPAAQPAPGPGLLGRLLGGLRRGGGPAGEGVPTWDGDDAVAGYVGIWFLADEAHITSIATRESCRGMGIGELLMIGTVEQALRMGSRVVSLEVRVSNEPAQSLYRKYSFQTVGIRKRYYSDNNEDAFIMTTDPIASPEYQQRFQELLAVHQERLGFSLRGRAP